MNTDLIESILRKKIWLGLFSLADYSFAKANRKKSCATN